MRMPAPETDWTAQMALALPDDGNRYEVLDRALFVTPSPSRHHQSVLGALHWRVYDFVRENHIGALFASRADIVFAPDVLVQPDLFVVPLVDGQRPNTWSEIHALVLAVEVLSPSTAFADRKRKRHIYMAAPVDEYWIFDLDARVVERWVKGSDRAEVLTESLNWHPREAAAPLTIDLLALFEQTLGNRNSSAV
jgi:Uma2 family endonuclease